MSMSMSMQKKEAAAKVVSSACGTVRQTWRDPRDDLRKEREQTEVDVKQLEDVLAQGGRKGLERVKRLIALVKDTTWGTKEDRYFLTRDQLHKRGLRVALGIRDVVKREGLSFDDAMVLRKLVDLPGGFELHFGMFIPTLIGQGTPEQVNKWLKPSLACKIIGTYAQTEMGHGTFLRGLETVACFDRDADEFVIHSPTPTATKWWPGGLGKTATHAVVMSRLFLDGKDYGPHPFVMQIRDLATHKPMPGVAVGDIGPKMGYNGVDNGYLRFDHVRVPRDSLLQKYSKVTREGEYIPPHPSNTKSSYATLVFVRADIVKGAGEVLSKAATIAVRYNAVRRQTTHMPGSPEEIILNYQQSARNLIPMAATSYALHFMGESMMDMYKEFEGQKEKGHFGMLPELHATSSCLKALTTWLTVSGIETCRQACGGYGYSALSGLPSLYCNYVQNLTWEGDNTILCLQTARYIVKNLLRVLKGHQEKGQVPPLADTVRYLAGAVKPIRVAEVSCVEHLYDSELLDTLMSQRCVFYARSALETLESNARKHKHSEIVLYEGDVWNASHVRLVGLAKTHGWLLLHRSFFKKLGQSSLVALPAATRRILHDLALLFTLTQIEDTLGDFLEAGVLTQDQAPFVHEAVQNLLTKLRPDVVALVDAFAHDDYALNSAIGSYDGDVYNRLLAMAKSNPFNATEEGPAWQDILGPFLNRQAKSKL